MNSSHSTETDAPPSRASIFNAFGKSHSSQSLPVSPSSKSLSAAPQLPPIRSPSPLARRPPAITTQTLPIPKTPEMRTSTTVKIFNWGSKPTNETSAPKLDLKIPSTSTAGTLDSFSLKSFRPVRPISPAPPPIDFEADLHRPSSANPHDPPSSQSPSTLLPPSPILGPRSRGASVGSDASQKITVAQFRQAQLESAKNRSSVHLPIPDHPSDSMPPGNVPLHVTLGRPVSPNPGCPLGGAPSPRATTPVQDATTTTTTTTSARTSPETTSSTHTEGPGAPSRPARLLPPQAIGRSSPVQRTGSPGGTNTNAYMHPAPQRRTTQPLGVSQPPSEETRPSAKWMASSSEDTDGSQGEDTASDGEGESSKRKVTGQRPVRKPPLIPGFQQQQQQSQGRSSPSSFASASRTGLPTSRSDSDQYGSGNAGASFSQQQPQVSVGGSARDGGGFTPLSPSMRSGEYGGAGRDRPDSVATSRTSQSMDVWSNTHSTAHLRRDSNEEAGGPLSTGGRKETKSGPGHGGGSIFVFYFIFYCRVLLS